VFDNIQMSPGEVWSFVPALKYVAWDSKLLFCYVIVRYAGLNTTQADWTLIIFLVNTKMKMLFLVKK